MKVSDLMSTHIVTVPPEFSAAEAARTMERNDVGLLPVCGGNGELQGVLTDRDIVTRCIAARIDPRQVRVQDLMTRDVVSVSPDEDVKTAARIMSGEQIRRLPVLEHDRIVGVLSLADLLHSDIYDMEAAQALTEITDSAREY